MTSQPVPEGGHSRRLVAGICAALAVLVLSVFSQTLRNEFVNYDDDDYVVKNSVVSDGLSMEGIKWAFTHVHSANWHPVTWLSHMLDCQIFGLNPGGHHLTSVLLHAATAVLLFLALRRLTSDACRSPGESLPVRRSSKSEGVWCSAFAAALFAIHPLRVESVAWVAERKDVLSGLFFMLTLLAYARYAKRTFSIGRYLAVVVFFALGLMSKPMLVTLPFVLLLLDYWPLGRLPADSSFPIRHSAFLISEKLPLFVMSAISCLVTMHAQTIAMAPVAELPLTRRLGNALAAYVIYLWQTVWPTRLAILYPHPNERLPVSVVILSFLILAAVSVCLFAMRRKHPYVMTGWLWYMGMLVPVAGLMQVGNQAHADRYTYLPQIGLFILLTWGAADVTAGWRQRRMVCGVAASLVLAALAGCTWRQTSYWRDSLTLWTRALDSTSRNALAHGNLGDVLASRGKFAAAEEQYRKFLRINPASAAANTNLGTALASQGKLDEAMESYERALKIDPHSAEPHFRLGFVLAMRGEYADAIAHYTEAVRLAPGEAPALNNLAWLLAVRPEASLRNGARAIELARQANKLSGDTDPGKLDTLAAAFAEAGQFPEAIETARRALDLAVKGNDKALAEEIRARLQLYETGLPYHEEARKR